MAADANITAELQRDFLSRLAEALGAIAPEIVQTIRAELANAYPPPSGPGESPHLRSGTLHDSIAWEIVTDDQSVTLVVYTDCPYASFLEEGTAKLASRPFMLPAFDQWSDQLPVRVALLSRSA